jgi:transaldolase
MADPLADLSNQGVSIWLDDLSRERLTAGSLANLVAHDHVVGVTTNPTIFAKAISGSDAYTKQVRDMWARGAAVGEALRGMTAFDVRWACDVLRPVYDATDGVDGRVSIEVDPRLAYDTEATIAEARFLWWLVDRPNLLVKIPAARQGLPAIAACLADGISINVTLIFSLVRYDAVMDAFLDGLERARQADRDLSSIASVASFFVSRVDTEVDTRLDKIGTASAAALRGRAAIANARLAYQHYERMLASPRWAALGRAGGGGGAAAAAAVGLDVGQGPGLPGHPLRDRPGRARRGQHHARGHLARGGRPWPHPRGLGAQLLRRVTAGAQRTRGARRRLRRRDRAAGERRPGRLRRQLAGPRRPAASQAIGRGVDAARLADVDVSLAEFSG